MNLCIKRKIKNAIEPVSSGAAAHDMNMFLVAFQLIELKPLAAILKPQMHPITCNIVDFRKMRTRCEQVRDRDYTLSYCIK